MIFGPMLGASDANAAWQTGLLAGLLLAFAVACGHLANLIKVPRVAGYLVGGVLCHQFAVVVGHEAAALRAEGPLETISYLALGVILFTIGGVFEVSHLRSVGRRLTRLSIAEIGGTAGLVCATTTLVGIGVAGLDAWRESLAIGMLFACAAIETAPAATMFVLREYEAKGPVTDTIQSMTGVNNIVCILAFGACFAMLGWLGWLGDRELPGGAGRLWIDLLVLAGGSATLGIVIGFVLSLLHARSGVSEMVIFLLVVLLILGAGEEWLRQQDLPAYSFLLATVIAGAVFSNVAIDPQRLADATKAIANPILIGFFALAGFELHLSDLVSIGLIGIAYIAARFVGKWGGVHLGIRWAGRPPELRPYVGLAMLCQAALAVGIAAFVKARLGADDPIARRFSTTVLGSIVIFELLGPLLTKWVVVRSGEVKAASLLRRSSTTMGWRTTVALAVGGMLRMVGLGRSGSADSGRLMVRHVMRSNIKSIAASATFDDVLSAVEQSSYNHFPVVDAEDRLVGVVHYNDLREILYNRALADLVTAADLASTDTRCVAPETPLTELQQMLHDWRVSSLPVVESVESRRVVGIVEQRDVLRVLRVQTQDTTTR